MKLAGYGDYHAAAPRKLPAFLFDYTDGGSYAEHTLRRNASDVAKVGLRQRVLRDSLCPLAEVMAAGTPMASSPADRFSATDDRFAAIQGPTAIRGEAQCSSPSAWSRCPSR